MSSACATCALPYGNASDPISEKPLLPGRHLACCDRSICSRCLNQNKRYETYCPYCQISTEPSPILPQGLREPPAYSSLHDNHAIPPPLASDVEEELPPYSANGAVRPTIDDSKTRDVDGEDDHDDVLHFLTPADTMQSLSLAYGVPINALRRANGVFSDHLLQGRKTALIPGEYYKGGVSLSPRPVEGEEEEGRKMKVRRWMVACKVAEYDVALLYLEQALWNLDDAIDAYKEDERWEKEHPLEAQGKGKKGKSARDAGMRRFVGGSANGKAGS